MAQRIVTVQEGGRLIRYEYDSKQSAAEIARMVAQEGAVAIPAGATLRVGPDPHRVEHEGFVMAPYVVSVW